MMKNNNNEYDIVFAGGGCAAYSLLCNLALQKNLHYLRILIIDADDNKGSNRTWSFWEKKPNLFSHLALKNWQNLDLAYNGIQKTVNIKPYKYLTILGKDFFSFAKIQMAVFKNLDIVKESVTSINNIKNGAEVITDKNYYQAKVVYNSIFYPSIIPESAAFMWQHFLGYFITTPTNVFDDSKATWMNFDVPQQDGMAFMYLLPFSANTALVEYTVFSPTILANGVYENENEKYLKKIGITDYKITDTEQYAIPMTSYKFKRQNNNIINIGSAGGATRASTGFTFMGIQKQAAFLAKAWANNKKPYYNYSLQQKLHLKFDATLLHVLLHKKLSGEAVFGSLFEKNELTQILKFLDGETSITETLKIMNSTDIKVFATAFFKSK
jgi:lycopene beta-cyclase